MRPGHSRPYLTPLAALLLLLAPACGGDDGDDGPTPDAAAGADSAAADAMLSQRCIDAADHSDLPWIQDNILGPSCANFSACHMGNASQALGLNLESGMSEANMVDVDSVKEPTYKLVVAGDPDQSYLMIILGDRPGPVEQAMPLNNPKLCQPKLDAIARWISALP